MRLRRRSDATRMSTRRRILLWASVAIAALLVAWGVVGYLVIVDPKVNQPTKADAIMVLGPSFPSQYKTGLQLADQLHMDQLVLSVGDTPSQIHDGVCAQSPPGVHVTCFKPSPYTTRGEARELRSLASEKGWTNVIVVTSRPHISRSRMLMKRCFDGTVQMVPSEQSLSFSSWVARFVYESAAMVKAELVRGC